MLGRYYTYLDIWVRRVIRINIKNGNKRFSQASSISSIYAFVAWILFLHTRHSFLMYAYWFGFINTHVLIQDTCTYLYTSLGIHLNICWGVSDSPGLACSGDEAWIEVDPPPKIKLTSWSRLTSPSSFCSWLFLLACGIPLQLVSIFGIVHIVNLTFVSGNDVMYL